MEDETITKIEELASVLTPPSQMAAMLGIDEDILKHKISIHGTKERMAFLKGMSATADKLRRNNIELANAGSPEAIRSCFAAMNRMLDDVEG